jgi:Polyketide cyclase / dehydrase and lipid transport
VSTVAVGRAVVALVVALLLGLDAAGAQAPSPPPPAVKVETRAIPDRDVKQVTAQAIITAPPHVVRAVIADLERYPAFMPYVKDSRILGREPTGDVLNYQRLSFGIPFVQDRHYVIRIAERRSRDPDGRSAFAFIWHLEAGLPPGVSPDAAVRVSVNNGYWDLRPVKDSDGSTDVRYCVFTDPAGALPKWIVGMANTEAVPELFAAVAGEAAKPRYVTLPAPPADQTVSERPALLDCTDTARPVP